MSPQVNKLGEVCLTFRIIKRKGWEHQLDSIIMKVSVSPSGFSDSLSYWQSEQFQS